MSCLKSCCDGCDEPGKSSRATSPLRNCLLKPRSRPTSSKCTRRRSRCVAASTPCTRTSAPPWCKPRTSAAPCRSGGEALDARHRARWFTRIWMLEPDSDTWCFAAAVGLYTHLDAEHARVKWAKPQTGPHRRNPPAAGTEFPAANRTWTWCGLNPRDSSRWRYPWLCRTAWWRDSTLRLPGPGQTWSSKALASGGKSHQHRIQRIQAEKELELPRCSRRKPPPRNRCS